MSILTEHKEPRTRLWSADEYYELAEIGLFQNERVELIEGEIVQMSPQNNRHGIGICLVLAVLHRVFSGDYLVRPQLSFDISSDTVVDPDFAVVEGNVRKHDLSKNPTTALLIVEVSDSTLYFDRNKKGSLYAKAGIPDYWIVNLQDRQLEVHRNPQPDESKTFGYGYADVLIFDADAEVAPLAKPNEKIKVADLLP